MYLKQGKKGTAFALVLEAADRAQKQKSDEKIEYAE